MATVLETRAEKFGARSFQIESDLHLEGGPNRFDPYEFYTFPHIGRFLLLPGDIGSLKATHATRYKTFTDRMRKEYDHVFLIAGNAEWKNGNVSMSDTLSTFKKLPFDDIGETPTPGRLTVLENETYDMETEYGLNITILGCTMWSKIRADAPRGAGDGASINGNSQAAHNARYEESIAWIRRTVLEVRHNKPNHTIIVMTHHAPTIRGSGQKRRELSPTDNTATSLFSAYQTDILGGESVEGLRANDIWTFGHTHFSCDFEIDDVRVVANQRGGAKNDGAKMHGLEHNFREEDQYKTPVKNA
ncbi:uncharacterized protein LY89DRAFT_725494 [Mollisia scopiformis]|uniref:Uncharacterized protein n=1 Tax=Mollisia scopiformis TaxID=149040 RepID=A0A132B5P3_MOLSC|nr:uncharacterized protein LY89DRAFT_725494 [Mollisia scopiformis]KUJ07735.1 hypothetical protein LY89DRAFT_725494 [Mollisia scopiformis]